VVRKVSTNASPPSTPPRPSIRRRIFSLTAQESAQILHGAVGRPFKVLFARSATALDPLMLLREE